MNPLQDPNFILALVGAVVTFVGIIVIPILFFWKQQNRKGITYELISDEYIVNSKRVREKVIEVRLYDGGEIVENLNQIVMRFWNSGNQTIKREDIDVPVQIFFGENAEIIDCFFSTEVPIHPRVKMGQNNLTVALDSINPKEDVLVSVLVTGYTRKIEYKAHIVGGVFRERKNPRESIASSLVPLLLAEAVTLTCFTAIALTNPSVSLPKAVLEVSGSLTVTNLIILMLRRPIANLLGKLFQ